MVDYDHPANGETPWGDKNTANHELSGVHIDALEGIVFGGTTGQVWTKASDDDGDIVWQDSPESGISPSIVDAKGDLITATAADTPARLAVGADGKILSADSGESTGLAWVDPPEGGVPEMNGVYIRTPGSVASGAGASGDLYFCPLIVWWPVTVDAIIVQTAGATYANVNDVGIYGSNANGTPLLTGGPLRSATVTFSSVTITATFSSIDLDPGLYWGAFRFAGTQTIRAVTNSQVMPIYPSSNYQVLGYYTTGAGSLPSAGSLLEAVNYTPMMILRTT